MSQSKTSRRSPLARFSSGVIAFAVCLVAASCVNNPPPADETQLCTDVWRQSVEDRMQTGDSEGHGPDVGSLEWQGVVEFKLGVRGQSDVPPRDSDAWCRFVDERVRDRD